MNISPWIAFFLVIVAAGAYLLYRRSRQAERDAWPETVSPDLPPEGDGRVQPEDGGPAPGKPK